MLQAVEIGKCRQISPPRIWVEEQGRVVHSKETNVKSSRRFETKTATALKPADEKVV